MEDKKHTIRSFAVPFVSGGLAGITAKTFIAPLERVKIIIQTDHEKYKPYDGVYKKLKMISKHEGKSALFKGNSATIARVFPYAAVHYEFANKLLNLPPRGANKNPTLKTALLSMLAGSTAGVVSVSCTYPLDLVRARMAIDVDHQGGLFQAIHAGVNFSSYETLRSLMSSYYGDSSLVPTPAKVLCGGIAGAFGQTVAYPLDVVRRRMQTSGYSSNTKQIDHSKSTLYNIRQIIRNEGWQALFKGLSINYYKVVPAVSISFTVYEYLLNLWSEK
ncbi:hypothetical protein AKO1_007751 [Acrasis kona]|uniref:Mitochondrial carrier protein n=1 Tax=Acrasis kona TaxID=1008807 RepID=A0AAW2YQX5_9EUKA